MLIPHVRATVLLRSLKHQLSCLSVRGNQHQSCERNSIKKISVPHSGLLSYHQPWNNIENGSVTCSAKRNCNLQMTQKYKFLNGSFTDITVGDIKPNLKYDCPKVTGLNTEISAPSVIKIIPILPVDEPGTNQIEKDSPGTSTLEKLANKDLITTRKRKMKKHQRKRLKARMWPTIRKVKFQKERKKKVILARWVAQMKKVGEEYDAFAVIKDNLKIAKTKGYSWDIFSEKSKHFGFADDLKQKK